MDIYEFRPLNAMKIKSDFFKCMVQMCTEIYQEQGEIIQGKPEICVGYFSMRNPYMEVSRRYLDAPYMHKHTHGQAETNMSPIFSKLGA